MQDDCAAARWHNELLQLERLEWKQKQENKNMSLLTGQMTDGYQAIPPGVYPAVSNLLVDLGKQGGGKFDPVKQIMLGFQIPGTLDSRGKPETVVRRFTQTMGKKGNLRKFIEGWFGKSFPSDKVAKDFDPRLLLNRATLLTVGHNDNGKAIIVSASGLPAGMEKPVLEGSTVFYASTAPDAATALQTVPEWIQKIISEQLEDLPKTEAAAIAAVEGDDDIPF